MKKILKKTIPFLLAVLMLLQCTGCKMLPAALMGTAAYILNYEEEKKQEDSEEQELLEMPEAGESAAPEEVNFSEIKYERPDTKLIRDAIAALEEKLENGNPEDENLVKEYKDVTDMYLSIDTQSSIAYVLYSMDVTVPDYQEEYEYLEGEMNEIDLLLIDLTIHMFENEETGDEMRSVFGEEYEKNVYDKQKRNSPKIQDDIKKDLALASEYDKMLTTFAMQDGDKTYTMDELLNMDVEDSDAYEEYYRLIQEYYSQLNEKGGEIFLKLVEIRNRIAKTLGYENYSDYSYEDYSRDYTTEDIKEIQAAVKEYIVPIYTLSYFKYYYLSGGYDKTQSANCDYATFMNKFQTKLEQFSPGMKEAFDSMIRNDLISTNISDKKMETSYTTYFGDYHEPYIFTQWENKPDSLMTIIHEFGHFSNYYLNPIYGWNISDPLDIAEIDSQGLELLMMRDYEYFFGQSKADAFRVEKLLDAMYALISGCMEDEFQQTVYANPDITLDEMNDCYLRIAEEYGFKTLFDYSGKEWACIPHTFQSPLYYISYASSMIAALEIWEEALTDYVGAKEDYLKIQGRGENSEFRKLIMECGLADPISSETIQHLADTLNSEIDQFIN